MVGLVVDEVTVLDRDRDWTIGDIDIVARTTGGWAITGQTINPVAAQADAHVP